MIVGEVQKHAKVSFLGALSMSFIWLILMSQGYFALPLLPLSFLGTGLNCFFTALILPTTVLLALMGAVIGVNLVLNAAAPFLQWMNFKSDPHPWPYGLKGTVDSASIEQPVKVALHTEFTYELKEMKAKMETLSHELSREPTAEELSSRGLMRCFHLQKNQLEFFQLCQSKANLQEQYALIEQRNQNFNRQLGVKHV